MPLRQSVKEDQGGVGLTSRVNSWQMAGVGLEDRRAQSQHSGFHRPSGIDGP